jgi:hypothetical protein
MTEKTGLELLRQPFPPHQISKLPKESKAQADERKANRDSAINCQLCGGWHHRKAVHLDYVGHAALTDRLLDADPAWTWEPLSMSDGLPLMDNLGGMWIKLTVCGITRLGYGHAGEKHGGDAIKEVIGDALRNAAMRFGAALELWHKGDLHADAPEQDSKPSAHHQPHATHQDETRRLWMAETIANINGAKNSGDFKRIVAEAIAVAQGENDADMVRQIQAAADAKAATAKARAAA